jgi:muramoyltetrapeptide carboxypeptidase LdcA involved in peptidoglycan recycling
MLAGIAGVAVGQFLGYRGAEPRWWTIVDVLVDGLTGLGVPVLGGLPICYGWYPPMVPLGTRATSTPMRAH